MVSKETLVDSVGQDQTSKKLQSDQPTALYNKMILVFQKKKKNLNKNNF